MTDKPDTFTIDDREIDIRAGETIFRAARRLDIKLPHLCYSPKPGYRPDGNCRVCMVAIEVARDPDSELWKIVKRQKLTAGRFPKREAAAVPAPDRSHVAMAVNLDACIQCNLCVRACREVQVNDVIGMAGRGHLEKIVFDFDDPMG